MKSKTRKQIILSVRVTRSQEDMIQEIFDNNEQFGSVSEAVHSCILYGIRHYALMRKAEDPEFVNKIEKQIHMQLNVPNIEQTIRLCDIDEIDAILIRLHKVRDEQFNKLIK